MSSGTKLRRHRWVKIRVHTYICRHCGTGRVNSESVHGQWSTTFHLTDGTAVVSEHVPPCEAGPKTGAYLERYKSAIVCADER